jgi:hypothetical protein
VWPALYRPGTSEDYEFDPYWVALGKDGDTVTRVHAIAWDEANNLLYVGGEFTHIGDIDATNVAKLDMETGQWYALDDGLAGICYSLGVLSDGTVYAGTGGTGHFWEWDGSSWTDLTSGGSGPTNAIYIDGSDNAYLGGAFSSLPGAASAKYAGLYNGTTFTALAGLDWTGAGTGGVYALDSDDVYVYATGKFDGGYAKAWNGSSWETMGAGIPGVGYAVAVHGSVVAFAGAFTSVQQWNGSEWTTLGVLSVGGGPSAGATGAGLVSDGNNLYLTGFFVSSIHCARWDGSEWVSLGGGLLGGTGFGFAITLFDNLHPVVGGDFTSVDSTDIPAAGIAMYIVTLEGLFDHLNTRGGSVGRPGGPDKAVQYNRDGRFGGEKAFTYDETNDNLILGPYTPPIAGSKTIHQINEGASPAHFMWAFTSSYAPFIAMMKANGDSGTPTALLADEVIGRWRGRGHDGTGYSTTQMEIRLLAKENWDGSGHGTYYEIYVTPENSTTLTKIATIDEDGIDLAAGLSFSVNGTSVVWDGDIDDVDTTSGSEIGADLEDADRLLGDDDSGGNPVWILLSRVWTYIKSEFITDPILQGGKPVWDSATGYHIEPGTGFNVNGSFLDWASNITRSSLSLSNNTGYYVYLYDNSGTDAVEESTTAPAWNSTYYYWQKTGDATRRCVGWFFTDGSGNIEKFHYIDRGDELEFYITAGGNYRALNAGTGAAGWTSVTLQNYSTSVPYVPSHATHAYFIAKIFYANDQDEGAMGVSPIDLGSGVLGQLGTYVARAAGSTSSGNVVYFGSTWFPLVESQTVYYRMRNTAGTNAGYIDLQGARFPR